MERMTEKTEGGYGLLVSESDAARRLGRFEDAFFALTAKRDEAAARLSALRSAGKTKTVQFREALGAKLTADDLLSLMKVYDIE